MEIKAELKHELLSHIKYSFEDPIKLRINYSYDLDRIGICNVLFKKLSKEYLLDSASLKDLLIILGIERKSWNRPEYWFDSYEQRKQAIDECWDRWITSTQYEEWQNRLLTENKN